MHPQGNTLYTDYPLIYTRHAGKPLLKEKNNR